MRLIDVDERIVSLIMILVILSVVVVIHLVLVEFSGAFQEI